MNFAPGFELVTRIQRVITAQELTHVAAAKRMSPRQQEDIRAIRQPCMNYQF